jgi:hypothetical protein
MRGLRYAIKNRRLLLQLTTANNFSNAGIAEKRPEIFSPAFHKKGESPISINCM